MQFNNGGGVTGMQIFTVPIGARQDVTCADAILKASLPYHAKRLTYNTHNTTRTGSTQQGTPH